MLTPQFVLPIASELVVDLFAGGGGASTGIEQAIGRHVDIAVNHDPQAISLHTINHPQTRHFVCDVFKVKPLEVTKGQPVGLLWASPDCTYHSKARGGKPHRDRNKARRRRGLAGVVIHYAEAVRPRIIAMENVEEFQQWGPLLDDGTPCPDRRGTSFNRWVARLRNLGYVVEWRELRASDYGTPTIRKRLFIIARCDGEPIVWPEATHGKPGTLPVRAKKLKAWRTAAECIDWDIECPSIFERKKPLAEATLRRIAKGVMRYVVDAAEPFIVPMTHTGGDRVHGSSEPLRTVTTAQRGEFALAVPTLIQTGYGERPGQAPRVPGLEKPLGTAVDGQKHALVTAFLAQHNNHRGIVPSDGRSAEDPVSTVTTKGAQQTLVTANLVHYHADKRADEVRASDAREPMKTQTTANRHAVVTSNLVKLRGTSTASASDEPLHTVSAMGMHHAEVRAFLIKYYGTAEGASLDEPAHTIPTHDRFGLVTVRGEKYQIVDIGLRMLTPRELYRAQGFPDSYIIDRGARGEPMTKTAQVRMCGNSVCPPLARAIVAANYRELGQERAAA